MAFAHVGSLGGGGFKAAGTTNMPLTTTAAATAGNLTVLVVGLDNTAGDVAGSIVTSVGDSAGGNRWQRAHEATTAGAADNASVSVWFCTVKNTIGLGGTIDANFSSRGAGAIHAREFSMGAGLMASVVGVNSNVGAA